MILKFHSQFFIIKFIENCNEDFQNKIDVLINNAGITLDNLTIRMKDDEWHKVLNLNLTCSRSFLSVLYQIKLASNIPCIAFFTNKYRTLTPFL